jgi:hypothetical protein
VTSSPFLNLGLQNSFSKIDVLSWVLKTLNFEDKISIRKGECNTIVKNKPFYLRRSFPLERLTRAFDRIA